MKGNGTEPGNMITSPSGCSMLISLDDELEWQHGSRTHSPRTPTSSDVLRSLRRMSPPPTASIGNAQLEGPDSLENLSRSAGLEALLNMVGQVRLRSSIIRGDLLCLSDGISYHLGMDVPLQGRVIEDVDESSKGVAGKGTRSSNIMQLTIGSVWLSAMAERTYESQLCALLRARKNIQEIQIEDRLVINRFLLGNLSVDSLKNSHLWMDRTTVKATLNNELNDNFNDYLSIRTRRRDQLRILEEKKGLLEDQQMRLRRLLARELQRLHSTKAPIPTVVAAPPIIVTDASAVANMLKRPKAPVAAVSEPTVPAPDEFRRVTSENLGSTQIDGLRAKLRCLHVEWYRVGDRLRNAVEAQTVLERKLKRLRYVMVFPRL